jgi:hypothetical protein
MHPTHLQAGDWVGPDLNFLTCLAQLGAIGTG